MSNRTLVELNHDFCPDEAGLMQWARRMKQYMHSGDAQELPAGVTWLHMRHHTRPCPVRDAAQQPQPSPLEGALGKIIRAVGTEDGEGGYRADDREGSLDYVEGIARAALPGMPTHPRPPVPPYTDAEFDDALEAFRRVIPEDAQAQPPAFVSACCDGETCSCGRAAGHKVSEVIQYDDPQPNRHPLAIYVCHACFRRLMGPAADRGEAAQLAPGVYEPTDQAEDAALGELAEALAIRPQPSQAQQPAGGVPEGWKMVPVEPTPEMMRAAEHHHELPTSSEDHRASIFRAMLAAAPTPPAAEGWQDIATAPRDGGRALLVWCPENLCTYLVYWGAYHNDDGSAYGRRCEGWVIFGRGGPLNKTPTMWRPLPAPPAAGEG